MAESRLYRRMAAKLTEVRTQQIESLGLGAAMDYAAYRDIVGYIRGLSDAIKLCEEIDKGME